jgi:6-pyruvoyl-tetrahydropterin synthase
MSWFVDLTLTGPLDGNGFIEDFSLVKRAVKSCLKATLDHALILPSTADGSVDCKPHGESSLSVNLLASDGRRWSYIAPMGAVYQLVSDKVDASTVSEALARELADGYLLPSISDVAVTLRAEAGDHPDCYFTYTHGLPGHQGLCQRLFHGHRSRLEIEVGGVRRADLEKKITQEFFGGHVHIATEDQIVAGHCPPLCEKARQEKPLTLGFHGSLGKYHATLPAASVVVVKDSTSIESLTNQLAIIGRRLVGDSAGPLRVKCHEGIHKGAIATV